MLTYVHDIHFNLNRKLMLLRNCACVNIHMVFFIFQASYRMAIRWCSFAAIKLLTGKFVIFPGYILNLYYISRIYIKKLERHILQIIITSISTVFINTQIWKTWKRCQRIGRRTNIIYICRWAIRPSAINQDIEVLFSENKRLLSSHYQHCLMDIFDIILITINQCTLSHTARASMWMSE